MTSHESSFHQQELRRAERKLSWRIRLLQARLQQERELQSKGEEHSESERIRLEKSAGRIQRLEGRLEALQIQLQAIQAALHAEDRSEMAAVYRSPDSNTAEQVSAQAIESPRALPDIAGDARVLAHHIRVIAETIEEMAHLAVERAKYAEKSLEQRCMGRHLTYEYIYLHDKAERAQDFARKARQATEEADRLATALAQGGRDVQSAKVERQMYQNRVKKQIPSKKEIEEEIENEETVGKLAAAIIANTSGDATEDAEAISEISSVNAQNARNLADQAEQTLVIVHSVIKEGALESEAAQEALSVARQEVIYAHELIVRAEEATQRAMEVTANAQAEVTAQVAAFADEHREQNMEHRLVERERERGDGGNGGDPAEDTI